MKVVIKIEDTTRELLKKAGIKGETYNTIILRLLDRGPDETLQINDIWENPVNKLSKEERESFEKHNKEIDMELDD